MDCKYEKTRTGFDGDHYVEDCSNIAEVDGLCWEHAYQAAVKELNELKAKEVKREAYIGMLEEQLERLYNR